MPPEARKAYIGPHTVFFTNLGMLGMNVGLDVRVIDQIGLANPLAAHTARLEDGRIGHDKNLFPDWAVAEGPFLSKAALYSAVSRPGLDRAGAGGAEVPHHRRHAHRRSAARWAPAVLVKSGARLRFTKYRIDRVPMYELDPVRAGSPCRRRRTRLHRPARDGTLSLRDLSARSDFWLCNAAPPPRR